MGYDQRKHEFSTKTFLRDLRPMYVRFGDWIKKRDISIAIYVLGIVCIGFVDFVLPYIDVIFLLYLIFTWWLMTRDRTLPAKMPMGSPYRDGKNMGPGKSGQAEGILFFGNEKSTGEELWVSGSDARTHILYLGTTGSGKTEGLKSFATNAMTWGSGFIYVDGKADTDLWSSLSSLSRRFGRDDDLLVLNYMTGNSDTRAPSNTMNPFSSGSASYLSNMLTTLMPEAEGDNAMWKERAVSLISSLMPALTWKRDNQDIPLSVSSIRKSLNMEEIIKLSRDEALPDRIRESLVGYLDTLPGYVDAAFDDNGKEKPVGPDQPMVDTTTVRQQHGYLTMQFTRALQSLGDDYGYIFDAADADIDMVDVVLNRRILITLIPALEKSADETANLGKIVGATLRGMMGSTLGANLEGSSSTVIENKPSHSSTPFMTIFDEVGYYTTAGMGVMAAQARSLGFCLIFAAQDLQAMEKRVKEEARSITANCNLKIFGKLEDPTQTREFFENQIGKGNVLQAKSYKLSGGNTAGAYFDSQEASVEVRSRADYDDLKEAKEGEAVISFAMDVIRANIFYSNPGFATAMRVSRYVALPPPPEAMTKHSGQITKLRDKLCNKTWTAMKADVAVKTPDEIKRIMEGLEVGNKNAEDAVDGGIMAVAALHAELYPDEANEALANPSAMDTVREAAKTPPPSAPPATPQTPATPPPTQGNPMGTFAKGDAETKEPPKQQETQPVSYHDLIKKEEAEEQKAVQQEQTETKIEQVQAVTKQLDSEVQKIVSDAGAELQKNLFKSKDKDDTSKT
ncbi:MAG: TraM recognition domain-containing protein [Pseudomonadota bacterium]